DELFPQHTSRNQTRVLADFDGDRRLDNAELHIAGQHRCIRVQLGDSSESHLEFDAAMPGILAARDVNHDNRVDLIWLPQSDAPAVWIGDGVGHFARAAQTATDDRELRALVFGDAGPAIIDQPKEGQVFLAADPGFLEVARATKLSTVVAMPPMASCDC